MAEGSAGRKKIVMVGIPGVGKTTLVSTIADGLHRGNRSVSVHNFGTLMFEEANRHGISSRDHLRGLSIDDQQKYQRLAAEKISLLGEDVVIVDTHAFISTRSGFYPGLPEHVLKIIRPSTLISVSARPEEIYNRRMKDETRDRDRITIERIKKELSFQESIVSACSVLSGAPIKTILNAEGKIEEAAAHAISAMEVL